MYKSHQQSQQEARGKERVNLNLLLALWKQHSLVENVEESQTHLLSAQIEQKC